MAMIYTASFESSIGTIQIASTDNGVCKISLPGEPKREFQRWLDRYFDPCEIVPSSSKNRQIIDELTRYFKRTLVTFNVPLHQIGTDFQMDVWKSLKRIRYGTTISYKELASRSGHPGAFQAVGRANATNPLPIVVPCHRVVGVNNDLVGYAAGLKIKEFLLRLEGALLP